MSDKEEIQYFTHPTGLRVVYCHRRSMVGCCGLAINAGSRDESANELGLAHFVEHTIFKGTEKRRSWHIINRMEAVGGELNAYTTKEETMVYSIFPSGNLDRAAELIFDLAINSQFPSVELDKEREVVADEINSYLDSPADAVFDDFEDIAFAGSSLGHNILGTLDTVSRLSSENCRDYLRRFYTPSNMVFFYAGSSSLATVERVVNRYASSMTAGESRPERIAPAIIAPFQEVHDINSHQAHTVIGARIPGMHEFDRQALALFTNIIGGPGMNSRLNIALREKRGLVYSVDASTALYSDSGLFTIYFGCDPEDTERCVKLVHQEIHKLADSPMAGRALDRAKKQFLGQLTIGSSNHEQMALSIARATLFHNHALTTEQVRQRVMEVTPERLMAIAQLATNSSRLTLH